MKSNIALSMLMYILILALTGIFPVLPATVLQEENVEQAFENVLPCAVRIQTGEHYGSGSIYQLTPKELIVVTVRHVLPDVGRDVDVTFLSGITVKGKVAYVDEDIDVGFIGVSLSELPGEEVIQLKRVQIDIAAYEKASKNTRFFMIDITDKSATPACYKGAIVEKERFLPDYDHIMIYGDAHADPGMSGCGIFDECGNFIGILSGGTEQNEIAAVPLTEIEKAYKKTSSFPL